jgi:hypothetical protein
MMKKEKTLEVGRRDFMRTLGLGATAAVGAAAPLSAARADTETKDERRKARYKADSPHIQAYYKVNRYPTK